VILITTDDNQLTGTIPTEIGQLTVLTDIRLRKYDGCLPGTFFSCPILYLSTHHWHCCLFYFICATDRNDLIGEIPSELQTRPLVNCFLGECRAFPPPPFPFVLSLQGFSHTLAIVIIHIVGENCFDLEDVAAFNISCDIYPNCDPNF
jgi:hypothetical protein